jgi:sulfur relay (sulfurtransferase) DsrF/TusC family protein
MAKSLLIISRQAPWSGPNAREALDIVLAGGAFDLPIGLLLTGCSSSPRNRTPRHCSRKT